ncbi:sensor histidine kinase [Azospirillum griseum]|uniref:histidine kinase n=1 Tax=Azospirillum griseum TaxID=2496639 RepID=A0A3S0HYB0_9PROT|nr:sensor histidine kinase [Azospirillum griseum]RTR16731.1 PAS domain-containing protein [Azospirillum griseum]
MTAIPGPTREDCLDALLAANDAPQAFLDGAGRCVTANPAFCRLLGHDRAAVEGQRLGIPVNGLSMDGAVSLDGAMAGLGLCVQPVHRADGALMGFAVTGEGEELAQARRDRAASVRLLTKAAHDLRQPFQAMHLFHHLLAGRQSDPSAVDLAAKLGQSIQGAEQLLTPVLDILRLDAGTWVPQPRAFPIDDVLGRLLQDFAPEAEAKGLRFNVRPAEVEVVSDPLLLERLLRPILANAVRYTQRGGVLLATRRRSDRLRIEVWDSGVGIAPEEQAAIFEDFHRIASAEADRRAGLAVGGGLGLAVARRLARLLDLALTVRSRPGRGAIFAVDVPRAPQHARLGHAAD